MARNGKGLISYRYDSDRIAVIAGTGVKVWVIVGYQRLGMSDAEIQEALPHLTLEQVRAGLDYYRRHRASIDKVLDANNISDEEAARRQARYAILARIMKGETQTLPG